MKLLISLNSWSKKPAVVKLRVGNFFGHGLQPHTTTVMALDSPCCHIVSTSVLESPYETLLDTSRNARWISGTSADALGNHETVKDMSLNLKHVFSTSTGHKATAADRETPCTQFTSTCLTCSLRHTSILAA